MRRTEYLLTELRNSTDNVETSAIKDAELIGYFNYAQKLIQNLIFNLNPKADIFKAVKDYTYNSLGEYTLPSDIFAVNALSSVQWIQSGYAYTIKRIDPVENTAGYYTQDGKLVVKGFNNFDVRVTYFKVLPKMDKRWGKVKTVNSAVSLVVDTGYDVLASTVDDSITVVDKYGAQVLANIYIDSFTTDTWATTNALTGVTTANYVCMGANSVNASQLPDSCETYLIDYARSRIQTRNVYDDGGMQMNFSTAQKADIAALFANNQKDIEFPPITDYDSLDF